MKSNVVKAAAVQQHSFADKDKSLMLSAELIEQAASDGAQLVVLQELHSTLYFCQTENVDLFDLAETIPGPTTKRLSELAKKFSVVLVASIFERRASGIYHNTAVVFENNGDIAGIYRKMHIPDDPGFYEKFYFTPGDASEEIGFKPIATSIGNLGVLVCWDQWYPEAARLMSLAGADILIYPTAIGWDVRDDRLEQTRQTEAWMTIQRAHAVANNLPVIVANRVGQEPDPSEQTPGTLFWGNSFICGQQGEILSQGSKSGVEIISCSIDFSRTEKVRRIWPYLRDRRVDAYDNLTKRYID